MTYKRYKMLQKYINGEAQEEYKQGELIDNTTYETLEDCNEGNQNPDKPIEGYIYQWVTVSGEYVCNDVNKYTKEKEQKSSNNGVTWTDTGRTRQGTLIEVNSADCGYVPPTPPTPSEFVDLQTDTIRICRNTGEYGDYQNQCFIAPNGTITTNLTKVKLSVWFNKDEINYTYAPPCTWMLGRCIVSGAKYVTSTGQWADNYPQEPYRTLTHYDPDAAHNLNTVVFYVEGEPGTSCKLTVNFYCNDTVEQVNKAILTINFTENECRWTPIEGQYVCDGFDKYAVEKNQENINGVWTDITPLETRTGSLIEHNSEDCGFIPYSDHYLTVESLADNNNITFTRTDGAYDLQRTIYVSTDNGANWTSKKSGYSTPTVLATLNTGDKLLIKGTNNSYGNTSDGNVISSTDRIIIYGNIMSLKYGDNFIGETEIGNYAFVKMFSRNQYLISAENLVLPSTTTYYCYYGMFWNCSSLTKAPALPATTLAQYCYDSMFEGCTSLTTAPELTATALVNNCYSYMFNGCTSLNYIKAMFTTKPSTTYTKNWVQNVAASGTFVKNSAATWTTTGNNGIPTNWTVINE